MGRPWAGAQQKAAEFMTAIYGTTASGAAAGINTTAANTVTIAVVRDDRDATGHMSQGLQQVARRSNRQAERHSREQQQQEGHQDSQQLQRHQHQSQQQHKKLQRQQTKQQQKHKPKKQPKAAAGFTSKATMSRSRKQQQDQEQQPEDQNTVDEAEEAAAAVDCNDHRETAFHPALFSTTGRPLPVQPVSELGDGSLAKFRRGQVVAVVLPPDAASVPLALVELLEDVVYTREGENEVFVKDSFRGRELEEMTSDMHHYVRVTVRLSKFLFRRNVEQQPMAYVLEADEWDSLALLTLGEVLHNKVMVACMRSG